MTAPRLNDDRLSQLPQPILHNILRYLSQEEAVRTCTLSKSWRYLGPTRPNFTMGETDFKGSKQEFINVLERYLQLYLDHKICPQEFCLSMSTPDADSVLFLDKWIPVLVRDWAVEDFGLFFDIRKHAVLFDLPSVFFESESLQYLYLTDCNLSRVSCFDREILSVNLKELNLWNVFITEDILEKIICSCPLIELELHRCVGLRAIRIDKRARYLKRFDSYGASKDNEPPSLEIDVPSLENIHVSTCPNWYQDKKTYFPHLNSLSLFSVRLTTETFGFFSHNFPCLESLSLKHCYGFEEFELSSCSVKEFELSSCDPLNRIAIDVPSIVMFKYEGRVPESFSFTTNSEKWKSDINLRPVYLFNEILPGLGKVGQLLKAVSGSEISLDIRQFYMSLHLVSSFMDNLFCICRPRIIQRSHFFPESKSKFHQRHEQSTKLMCNILGMKKGEFESGRIKRGRHWRQDLEKVIFETRQVQSIIVEISDENRKKWRPILERSWSEFLEALLPKDSKRVEHCIRFGLSWRE